METELKQEAKAMQLVYTNDRQPGYTRKKAGKGFVFLDSDGKRITDSEALKRIKSLVLPPAWTQVWICPKPHGHLQATGIDVAGRKQYKYHPKWSTKRNERKHNRMAEFAEALPGIRKKLENDLQHEGFSKEKVLALAISIMDKTHIRVGNSAYTKLYGSFGLTTLRNRHVKITGTQMTISFVGKKGVFREVKLTHTRLSRLLKKLKDIPGHELFQFFDTDGNKKSIDSDSINEYLRNCTGKDFTAKDFRTWWGTVTALSELASMNGDGESNPRKTSVEVLDIVAKELGNTRTVCKKYYIHPMLMSYYEEGKLDNYLNRLKDKTREKGEDELLSDEEVVIKEFISKECN